MITCVGCGRQFIHAIPPLHCSCGSVTGEKNAKPLPNHWLPLHQYAVDHANNWDAETARVWFDNWCDGIPEYSCNCKAKWSLIIQSRPPVFDDPKSFFKWAWARHNDVSATIGKPPITLEKAVELYMGCDG